VTANNSLKNFRREDVGISNGGKSTHAYELVQDTELSEIDDIINTLVKLLAV